MHALQTGVLRRECPAFKVSQIPMRKSLDFFITLSSVLLGRELAGVPAADPRCLIEGQLAAL